MKRSNIVYYVLVGIGFFLFVVGGMLLVFGTIVDSTVVLYLGIGAILLGIAMYIILIIIFILNYVKRRRNP